MFRYKFNPYSCRWEIQLLCWGIFWRTLRGLSYGDLGDAQHHARNMGIPEKYIEQKPFDHRVPIHDVHDNNVLEKSQ